MTPFWDNYHDHPVMQFKAPNQPPSLNSEIPADPFVAGLQETHQTLRKISPEAQANQTKHAGAKEVFVEVGDRVWLSTCHFRTTRPSKKLDYKLTRPYTVSKDINNNANILNHPYTIRKQNVFDVSLLDHYKPPTPGHPPSEV
jgi:hypothetical protein